MPFIGAAFVYRGMAKVAVAIMDIRAIERESLPAISLMPAILEPPAYVQQGPVESIDRRVLNRLDLKSGGQSACTEF